MRHRDPASTRIYTEINLSRLRGAVEQIPRDESGQLKIFSLEESG